MNNAQCKCMIARGIFVFDQHGLSALQILHMSECFRENLVQVITEGEERQFTTGTMTFPELALFPHHTQTMRISLSSNKSNKMTKAKRASTHVKQKHAA